MTVGPRFSETGVDEMVPHTHFACVDCGDWVIKGTQFSSTGQCTECGTAAARRRHEETVAFEVEGEVFTLKKGKGHNEGRPRRKQGYTDEARAADHLAARKQALRRLVALNRPLYELLLSEEKARRGLDPRVTTNGHASSTIDLDRVLAEKRELERTRLEIAQAEAERGRI